MDRRLWSAALAAAALLGAGSIARAQGQPPRGPGGLGGPGGFRPGGPGFGGPGGGGMAGLLRMPEVQKELKLESAQIDLLEGLRPAGGPQQFQALQNLSQEERQKRFQTMREEQDKKVAEILDAKQLARLKQLELQQTGVRGLERKDVADALKLNQSQRQQVTAALQAERDEQRKMFQGFQPGAEPPSQDEMRANMEKMRAMRAATETKLNSVLTEAQKKQFKEMQGAPFTFPQRGFGPGGPGGPGGRRPGGGAGAPPPGN